MFNSIDILYIVLAFCALWLTAALFWLLWQTATIIKNVNDTVRQVRDTLDKMQDALDGIRKKFDNTSTALGAVMHTATKAIEYLIDKKMDDRNQKKKKVAKEHIETETK